MDFNYNKGLYGALESYSRSGEYPFHMPGHKRNPNALPTGLPYGIDITEIGGFDDLHAPSGILKDISDKARRLFHSERSYMLINGSTCGILASVAAIASRGGCVIAARNCHKSVYNACELFGLTMHYIYPPTTEGGICGSISPDSVFDALNERPDAEAVILTSPTYEGVISDIASIAALCRKRNVPLIVDSAHGAHLPFCSFGKKGEPIESGADIVITSLHKTLPALTQTALAHINGDRVDHRRFEKYLGVFETSSPSYPLMASIGACLDFIDENKNAFSLYEQRLSDFDETVCTLRNISVLCHGTDSPGTHGFFAFDSGKLTLSAFGTDITGTVLSSRLREDHALVCEMAYPTYALAMTSVCDTSEGFSRLSRALLEIDKTVSRSQQQPFPPLPQPKRALSVGESSQTVSEKYIYAYPPGIPIVTPGEIIGEKESEYIALLKSSGVAVREV